MNPVSKLVTTRSLRGLSRSYRLGLRVVGAGLLAATAAIHLDLYLTGYRTIPTIGWLFLAQVITAFLLAAAVLALGSRIAEPQGRGSPWRPWADTCCRCGLACSASPRSGTTGNRSCMSGGWDS